MIQLTIKSQGRGEGLQGEATDVIIIIIQVNSPSLLDCYVAQYRNIHLKHKGMHCTHSSSKNLAADKPAISYTLWNGHFWGLEFMTSKQGWLFSFSAHKNLSIYVSSTLVKLGQSRERLISNTQAKAQGKAHFQHTLPVILDYWGTLSAGNEIGAQQTKAAHMTKGLPPDNFHTGISKDCCHRQIAREQWDNKQWDQPSVRLLLINRQHHRLPFSALLPIKHYLFWNGGHCFA